MELNHKNIKRILGIITFTIVLWWAFKNLTIVGNAVSFIFSLLLPFILGICIAFIINIPASLIEEKLLQTRKKKKIKKEQRSKWKRVLSIFLSIIIFFGILLFVLFLVIPELWTAGNVFKENIPGMLQNVQGWLETMTINYPDVSNAIQGIEIDWNTIGSYLWQFAQSGLTTILQSSINFVVSTINTIVNITIAIIFAVYLLVQKEKLLIQAKKLVYAYCKPEKADRVMKVCSISNKMFHDFIGGQLTEACILGLLCFFGMLILQIPYAAAISILVGITALIPLVGAFIGTGVGVILIIASNPIQAVVFVLFIIILQQIEGNLIYPKVVGKSVGLPAIWVLVAITIGGSLLGLLGMALSVPISSILYVLWREDMNQRLEKKEIEIENE